MTDDYAAPMSWALIDRGLMELIGVTPEQIDRMTLSEIAVACMDPEAESKGNMTGPEDVVAYALWWHGLTPDEQLAYELESDG